MPMTNYLLLSPSDSYFLIRYSIDNYSSACYMKHWNVSYISVALLEIIILLT